MVDRPPRPLAHFTDEDLLAEFSERNALRRAGKCDRCEADRGSPSCDQPSRHDPRRAPSALPTLTLTVRGGPGSGKSTIAADFRQLSERNGYDLEIQEVET